MAVRGKNSDDEEWNTIYNDFEGSKAELFELSSLKVECEEKFYTDKLVCGSAEVGIIGMLEYEMYDIVIRH